MAAETPPLTPRTALVIGASSGIGRVVARLLATDGWNVVLAGRSEAALTAARVEIDNAAPVSGLLTVDTVDVGDGAAVDGLITRAEKRFGRVHAVVNTAAVVGYGRFEDVPAEVFDRVITTNLLGTANVARTALRHFKAHGGGDLVLTGSLLGKIAVPLMSPYVTSKWGVHGLVRMLQIEARQTPGINVSLVSPGSVNTPAYYQAANYSGWEGRPPPPVDQPEKVARAVLRVLSKPRREESVGIANPLVVFGFRVLPAVFDLAVTPLIKLAGLSRRPIPHTSGTVAAPKPDGDAEHGPWSFSGLRRYRER